MWRDIRKPPIAIAGDLPIWLFSQSHGVSFRADCLFAHASKHLNAPVGLNIHPKYAHGLILSNLSDNIIKMMDIIPVWLR